MWTAIEKPTKMTLKKKKTTNERYKENYVQNQLIKVKSFDLRSCDENI